MRRHAVLSAHENVACFVHFNAREVGTRRAVFDVECATPAHTMHHRDDTGIRIGRICARDANVLLHEVRATRPRWRRSLGHAPSRHSRVEVGPGLLVASGATRDFCWHARCTQARQALICFQWQDAKAGSAANVLIASSIAFALVQDLRR